ncbi:MAG: radical SAM protein [Paracoccaceae bacterium]|uniref:radical SAM protein n=1 Tax=Hyphomonas sp. TaxID=87 RepID=UPI003272BE97
MSTAVTDTEADGLFSRSPFYQEVELGGGEWFVYNSLLNSPRIVDAAALELLKFFESASSIEDCRSRYSGEVDEVLAEMISSNLIVPYGSDERREIRRRQDSFIDEAVAGTRLRKLEIAISDACNLRCPHCMHFNNGAASSGKVVNISHTAITLAIENFIAALPESFDEVIHVHFGNGEPLINWKAIEFAVGYCESKSDYKFKYAINSNLTLMSEEIAQFMARYRFRISTSLDGIKDVNDRQRVSKAGKGSYDRTLQGMRLLRDAGHPVDGFTATITDKNFFETDHRLVDLAVELGIKEIAMDFDLVNSTTYRVDECVALVFGLRQYARNSGVSLFGNWETPFKMLIAESWAKNAYAYCPAMDGSTLEFGVDGKIKTCGHTNTVVAENFDAKSALSKGSRYHNLLAERLPNNMDYCRGCEIEGACGGQCHVTQEAALVSPDILPRMCDIMRKMTKNLIIEQYGARTQT